MTERAGGAYGPGQWPEVPLRRAELFPVLTSAGVWLIFLVFPVVAIATGDAAPGLKALGYAGLAAFVVAYLAHFIRPWPVRTLPHWANTAVATAVLAACAVATAPAAGLTAFNLLPFTLAIWIFPHRIRVGIPVSVALAAGWLAAAWRMAAGEGEWWPVIPTLVALLVMIALRMAMEREENTRVLGEELALSRQREQLGRDVHDVLGHSLTVITLKAELARRLLEVDPERARAELDEVLDLSRRSLAEVRTTVGGLRAPDLAAQLASARTALDAAGITARLPGPADAVHLPAARRELFAWCLREAVTNVVRHSGASRCSVQLTPTTLTVTDDGVGLTVAGGGAGPATGAGSGNGLTGMRSRVAEAGGTLTLTEARPGRERPGTRLEVVL